MLRIKRGVRLEGLQPQMTVALQVAEGLYRKYGEDCVVTSGTDGRHSVGSLHHCGRAVDLRNRTIPAAKRGQLVADLQDALGPEYDVLGEDDHVHVEYDPR